MNSKGIHISEISQTEEQIVRDSTYIRNIEESDSEKESRMVVAKGWGKWKWGAISQRIQILKLKNKF